MTYIEGKVNRKSLLTAISLCLKFEGLNVVKKDGLVYPYICPAGYPTQGVGIRVSSLDVPPITIEEALDRFVRKLEVAELQTLTLCPPLGKDELKLGAITDFTFNLGAGRLKCSTLRKKINSELWDEVPHELRKWVFGGGRKLKGLVLRREVESLYFL